MKKWIGIEQLRPGMRIEKIDRPWFATPFLRHRMAITSAEQVEQLKACGVQTVEILADYDQELEEYEGDRGSSVQGIEAGEALPGEAAPLPTSLVPFEEELPAAKQVYKAAKTVIEGAMRDVRMGRAINMDEVNRVVSDMSESVLRNLDALTSLSRLKRFDEYTFYHSVNTSILAMSLAHALGYGRSALQQLGVGTLLHDIGKTKIPVELLNKPGRFEPHEMEIMKQHVLRGMEVLSCTTGLSDSYLRPTLEHHERVDGSGYPYRRTKNEISQSGLIAAVVDVYDAITSDRCYHKAKPAHEALRFLYLVSQKGHLDHGLVQRFIHVVGVFPVGSLVELNTGELAVVRRVHRDAPLAPLVLIVKGAGGALLPDPEECDLRQRAGTLPRSITTVRDPHECALNPSDYLDKEPA